MKHLPSHSRGAMPDPRKCGRTFKWLNAVSVRRVEVTLVMRVKCDRWEDKKSSTSDSSCDGYNYDSIPSRSSRFVVQVLKMGTHHHAIEFESLRVSGGAASF